MSTPLTEQEQINHNFIKFLESDLESLSYDIPKEFKYSERDDFYDRSTEAWATGEILDRIKKSSDAEMAIWGFCGDMLHYMSVTKNQDTRSHFHTAYLVGEYLINMFDAIAYPEEEEDE